jgi:hypothetical protein
MSSVKIHPLVLSLGLDVTVDEKAKALNKYLLDQDTTILQLHTRMVELETAVVEIQRNFANVQSQLAKVHIRDLISAFRNHVINNFSDIVDANTPRGKMNMKQLKNYSELVRKIKEASEGSDVANKVKMFSRDLDFDYITLINVSEETSDEWSDYRDLAHKLLGFLQTSADKRDQEAIREAQDIVEKLTPNSKPISSKLLEVVVRDSVVLEDTSRAKKRDMTELVRPSKEMKTPRK